MSKPLDSPSEIWVDYEGWYTRPFRPGRHSKTDRYVAARVVDKLLLTIGSQHERIEALEARIKIAEAMIRARAEKLEAQIEKIETLVGNLVS